MPINYFISTIYKTTILAIMFTGSHEKDLPCMTNLTFLIEIDSMKRTNC